MTLEKILKKLQVTISLKETPSVPARGLVQGLQLYRVVLARPIEGTRKDGKPKMAKMATIALFPSNVGLISTAEMVGYLLLDVRAGEQTYWEFCQDYPDRAEGERERLHLACKKVGTRFRRFFSEWAEVVTTAESSAPTAPSVTRCA
jgi:hypothetical protein